MTFEPASDARLHADDPLPPEDRAGTSYTLCTDRPNGDTLYRSEAPRLARYFRRRSPLDEVADLVQESFRRLLGVTSNVDHPQSYLSRIASNLVRDRAATSARHHDAAHHPFDDEAVAGPDPHRQLEARDAVARLEAALATLKPKTRDIFLMHRLEGLSYAQIADAMDMSVKGVEKQIAKALVLLRRRVGPL